jgi:hypothetical protein
MGYLRPISQKENKITNHSAVARIPHTQKRFIDWLIGIEVNQNRY